MALISNSLAFGQTLVYTARPLIRS